MLVFLLPGLFLGAPTLRAAGIEIVHEFTAPPTRIESLVEGSDGLLYGVGDGGEPVYGLGYSKSTGERGLLFRMTLDGTVTALHRFSAADGARPIKLIRGRDGVIYGLTDGNADYGGTNTQVAAPTLFRVTAEGGVETLYSFADAGLDEIVATAEGIIYGSRAGHHRGNDAIFKRTPDGTVSTLATVPNGLSSILLDAAGNLFGYYYTYRDITPYYYELESAQFVKITPAGVVSTYPGTVGGQWVAVDGKFYGSRGLYEGGHVSPYAIEIFRVTGAGSFKVLASIDKGSVVDFLYEDAAGIVLAAGGKLFRINPDETVSDLGRFSSSGSDLRLRFRAADGNYYGVPTYREPVLIRVTPTATATTVTRDFTGDGGSMPSGGLSRGLDGQLYGLTFLGGRDAAGTIFRFDPSTRTHANVHAFAPGDGTNPSGNLAVDSAGNFHGMTEQVKATPGVLFRCSPAGEFAVRATLPSGDYHSTDRAVLQSTVGRVALGGDGALYAFVRGQPKESLYRLSSDGVLKKTATLGNGKRPSELITGADGALYFTQDSPNFFKYLPSVLGRVAVPTGAVSVKTIKEVHTFNGRLALRADGDFFGVAGYNQFFRLTAGGRFTRLREGFQADRLDATNGFLRASDGRFYSLFFSTNGVPNPSIRAVAAGADGGYRNLGTLPLHPPANGTLSYNEHDSHRAALVEGVDGFLYGTLPSGGQRGGGVIFRFPRVTSNTAPVAVDDAFEFTGNVLYLGLRGDLAPPDSDLLFNDSDTDGDRLVFRSATAPQHGKVKPLSFDSLVYTPDKTFRGTDTFSYTVSDGLGGEATATVTVRNPFSNSGGIYRGILTGSDGVAYATFEIKLDGVTGAVTGKFTNLPPSPYAGSSRLFTWLPLGSHTSTYEVAAGDNGPGYRRTIQLTGAGELQITVTEGTAVYRATVARQAKTLPAGIAAGKYTLRLPAPAGVDALPGGDGYALGTVSAKGLVKLTGALPDGTKFSLGGTLTTDGKLSFHLPLYAKPKGYLAGTLDFTAAATTRQLGALRWVKPAQILPGRQLYPGGFETTLAVAGAPYTPPPLGTSALHVGTTTATYDFTASYRAQPALLEQAVTVDGADKMLVTAPAADALRLTLARTTGLLSGSFKSPTEAGSLRKFSGVLFQPDANAGGVFIGTNTTGTIGLKPSAP